MSSVQPSLARFSIIIPSLGEVDLLSCFLTNLDRTARRRYEVVIHVYGDLPQLPSFPFRSIDILMSADRTPGMGYASNRALGRASGEWLIWLGDDMPPLDGWDDFDGRIREDRVLCWDLIEPIQGSFPPPCDAGRDPRSFRSALANLEASRRLRPPEPGGFFGTYIFHRSLVEDIRWSEHTGAYSSADIDLPFRIFLRHPPVVFGRLGLSLYHFVHGSIERHPELRVPGEEVQRMFVSEFGVTIGDAYEMINQRSVGAWNIK